MVNNKSFYLDDACKRLKENTNWYSKSYSGYFFGIHMQAIAIAHAARESDFSVPYAVLFQNKNSADHLDYFWDQELLKEKRERIIEKVVNDPSFIDMFADVWDKKRQKFLEVFAPYNSLDFSQYNTKQLAEIFSLLYETYKTYAGWGYIVDAFLTNEEPDWLVQEIQSELGPRATSEVIETLTLPTYGSFINESAVLLYQIAQGKNENKNVDSLIEDYIEKYFWIRNNYIHYKKVTKNEVLENVDELNKKYSSLDVLIDQEKLRIKHNIDSKQSLINDMRISPRLRLILSISELFTHVQDERKEGVLRSNAIFYSLLERISEVLQIDLHSIFYFTFEELQDMLHSSSVNHDLAQKRREEGFLTIYAQNGYTTVDAQAYADYCNLDIFFPTHETITSIKGSIAYKGKVRGKVRVCRSIGDIKNFVAGEVLVANQTTPEFVSAMHKAVAFITDQGGITCHAAIIARELQKPCIIGTKIATQVFKDGDMVEVDAEQGIVTLITN